VIYAGNPIDGDADAGQIEEWTEQVKGNPDQLDRFVLQALNCDLLNYARGRLRQNKRETPVPPESLAVSGYVSGGKPWTPTRHSACALPRV